MEVFAADPGRLLSAAELRERLDAAGGPFGDRHGTSWKLGRANQVGSKLGAKGWVPARAVAVVGKEAFEVGDCVAVTGTFRAGLKVVRIEVACRSTTARCTTACGCPVSKCWATARCSTSRCSCGAGPFVGEGLAAHRAAAAAKSTGCCTEAAKNTGRRAHLCCAKEVWESTMPCPNLYKLVQSVAHGAVAFAGRGDGRRRMKKSEADAATMLEAAAPALSGRALKAAVDRHLTSHGHSPARGTAAEHSALLCCDAATPRP